MWKIIKTCEGLFIRRANVIKCKRTFLSDAYRCQEEWDKRLETPLLQKVKPFDFYLELEHKYNTAGKISAVDVDILVNSLKDKGHTEDLLDMLYKLRLTPETSFTLSSTHYAVTRYLLEKESPEQVFDVLNDRLNYGIFPDHHTYNMLMDTYIKNKDFLSAAKIATLLMLQEDAENPISNALAIYSCHKYLEKPDDWNAPEPEKDESTEEVKVRVRYLRNEFFDNHFDLTEPLDLIGKTLAFFGKHRGDTLGRTCKLRGLVLLKKYSTIVKLIDEWKDVKDVVFEEVLQLIKNDSPALFEGELSEELSNLKEGLEGLEKANLKTGSIAEEIERDIKKAVEDRAENDITEQTKKFSEWLNIRTEVLQKHLAEINKLARIKRVKRMKRDLEKTERLLTFFDKEEEIELQIEKILEKKKSIAIDDKILKKKLKREENYVPPEVGQRSRQ
ncbi:28S ribosomal protein S27, mitochondrial-like isoform X2 [Belonocnema kinseyi]|nr:28S ribosomal protein S27, mitochondrial-like isoform X2 [Belonocnema kinseyi]XP_033215934.1 28S ribosomal protein S27, mitochondrial-like isoform X2 [Belonocnema kinseyi]XP_033215935.1 28S ribosomal protein S27, mitochondrial-like isoform X2 [Belonocnema kinseyi]